MHHRASVLLSVIGVGVCSAMAFALLFAPPELTTGPSTVLLYEHLSPKGWGVMWAALAVLSFYALTRPRAASWVLVLLGGATFGWAAGLAWPAFTLHRTNLLTVIPWAGIAVSVLCVAWANARR